MQLRHLREDTEQPSLGGIWYVRFRPAGYAAEEWDDGEVEPRVAPLQAGGDRNLGIFMRTLSRRPALAGAAGVLGVAVLTAVLWAP